MTATHEAPPLSPDITVKPVTRRPKRLPFPLDVYQTAVGKKWVMAITGIMLMGFVFAHMIGNLKMYLGPEEYNLYAESLRSLLFPIFPNHVVLWLMRIGLIGAFALHLHSAYSLTRLNHRAKPIKFNSGRDYIAANWASRTMRWSGILVLAFLFIHLGNLTWGWKIFDSQWQQGEVYKNVYTSLDQWWLAAIYIVGNLALAVHLFHGAWSMFQSLGISNPRYNNLRRGFAIGFAAVVCGINISFPIAVLAGVVGP